MLSNWKWMSVLAAGALMSACGGGADPTARGAVAYAPGTNSAAIAVNHTSQQEANSDALRQCNAAGCRVVMEFSGNGTCGSLSIASNGAWGVASGGSKELADAKAAGRCREAGGDVCVIPQGLETQCN